MAKLADNASITDLDHLDNVPLEYRPGKWRVTCNNGSRNRHVEVEADCWEDACFLAPYKAGGEFQQWDVVGAKKVPPIQPEPEGWKAQFTGSDDP